MIHKNGTPRARIDWDAMRRRIAAASEDRAASREAKDDILAKRARTMARPLETAAANATDMRFATFALAGEHYGIEAHLVVEIVRLLDFAPLPGAPPHMVGITNLRGDILPVFDLRALLGLRRRALDDMSRLIVLGRHRADFGVLADATRELVALSDADLLPLPLSVSDEGRRYMRGVTKDALVILDGAALLEDPRLFCDQGAEARH